MENSMVEHKCKNLDFQYFFCHCSMGFILFYWNVPPGHMENITIFVFFWLWPENASGFFLRQTWCRIFRPIDWCHSLVPKKICWVIWDSGRFFVSLIWPSTRKRLIFKVWFRFWCPPFSISYWTPYSLFFVL